MGKRTPGRSKGPRSEVVPAGEFSIVGPVLLEEEEVLRPYDEIHALAAIDDDEDPVHAFSVYPEIEEPELDAVDRGH